MTSQGAGDPFRLGEAIAGWRACELQGGCWIGPDAQGRDTLQGWCAGDVAIWRWFESDTAAKRLSVEARGSGEFDVLAGREAVVGRCRVQGGRLNEAQFSLPAGHRELRLRATAADGLFLHAFQIDGDG